MPAFVRRFAPHALLVLALTGCRTYGCDHNTTDLTIQQYAQGVRDFEQRAVAARAELQALDGVAAQNPAVRPVLAGYAPLVATQDSLVKVHQTRLDALQNPPLLRSLFGLVGYRYREANRAYGALATDLASLNDRLTTLASALAGQPAATTYLNAMVDDSRYVLAPPFYHRLAASVEARNPVVAARTYRGVVADTAAAPAPVPIARPDSAVAPTVPAIVPTPGASPEAATPAGDTARATR